MGAISQLLSNFNPRSPHGERRLTFMDSKATNIFQSTLPARGATRRHGQAPDGRVDFNPRSPHGERRCRCRQIPCQHTISIHAPRTGSDHLAAGRCPERWISIHAPRTGSDKQAENTCRELMNFNPRSPHGERPQFLRSAGVRVYFNPRSPHGERLYKQSL